MNYIRHLSTFILYGLCLYELIEGSFISRPQGYTINIIVALLITRTIVRGYTNSLNLTIAVSTIFLFAYPSVAINSLYNIDVLPTLFVFIVFTDVLLLADKKFSKFVRHKRFKKYDSVLKNDLRIFSALIVWCSFAGIFIDASGFAGLFSFLIPFGVSLVFLEKMIFQNPTKRFGFLLIAIYLFVIYLYMVFQWSGYGRLVIGAFILLPLLIVQAKLDLGIRPVFIALVAPGALYLAQILRYGAIEGASQIFIGSAGHHLIVSSDVMKGRDLLHSGGVDAFISQFLLFFFNWIPRDFWPDKPIGVGLWSVDIMYGRNKFGAEYSQSIGFFGEQFLYLGSFFWIGLIIMLVTLVLVRISLAKISFGFVTPLVLFDVNLISYFWGGAATFGSRLWFVLIPAILTIYILSTLQQSVSLISIPRPLRLVLRVSE